MKPAKLFSTLIALLALVACGDKEPVEEPNNGAEPGAALVRPTDVAVVEGSLTTTTVTISWTAVSGAVAYEYKLQKSGRTIKNEVVETNSVTFTDLERQSDYRFFVYAVGAEGVGTSASSDILEFRTLTNDPSASGLPVPNLVVDKNGKGDYTTVSAALSAVPSKFDDNFIIYIKEGTYTEKISVVSDNIILVGDGIDKTVLSWDGYQGGGESVYSTLYIKGENIVVMDMTIENTHKNNTGSGDQAQAVHVHYGDKVAFYDCDITGYQDTFWGRSNESRVYVKNCYVEGNVDFIYGASAMLFEECHINVNRNKAAITAPSTAATASYGIVFNQCNITTDEVGFDGNKITSIYLGRAWHYASKCVWINCNMPATLDPTGWMKNMSEDVDDTKKIFAEWGCTYPSASLADLSKRQFGGRELTDEEKATYTTAQIFAAKANPAAGFKEDWLPEEQKPEISLE